MTFTPVETVVTLVALHAYRVETERYLSSYSQLQQVHGPCCEEQARRDEARREEQEILRRRMDTILSAIDKLS